MSLIPFLDMHISIFALQSDRALARVASTQRLLRTQHVSRLRILQLPLLPTAQTHIFQDKRRTSETLLQLFSMNYHTSTSTQEPQNRITRNRPTAFGITYYIPSVPLIAKV